MVKTVYTHMYIFIYVDAQHAPLSICELQINARGAKMAIKIPCCLQIVHNFWTKAMDCIWLIHSTYNSHIYTTQHH